MLIDYRLWHLHKNLSEANDIIAQVNQFLLKEEDSPGLLPSGTTDNSDKGKTLSKDEAIAHLPKLDYLHRRNDGQPGAQWFIDEERRINKTPGFNAEKAGIRRCLVVAYKEEEKKQREGIKFPPGVIVNKINHRVFNYDQIQDKITELVNNGTLECCDALDIRIALKDKLHQMGKDIIDMLTFPLQLPGKATVEKGAVLSTFERFYRRDMDELRTERTKENCGDCGGFRSSSRWSSPPRSTPPPRKGGGGFGGGPGKRFGGRR